MPPDNQSKIQQNLIPNEPALKDVLDLFKKDIFLSLNCHAIGTVKSFDSATQTAQATINYVRTYFMPDATGVYQPITKPYPVLLDCPVICLGGGGGALTFPVAAGDECLVLFNDRDLDNWFQGSVGSAVASPRLHSFSDGMILVGLRSKPKVLTSYREDAVELRNTTGEITAAITNTGKLEITNATGEFVAALVQLLTTATAGGFPVVLDPTALATLESFKGP